MNNAGYTQSGSQNVFIGYTTGCRNMGIGVNALKANTTGSASVPLGFNSWYEEIKYEMFDWIGSVRREIDDWIK